MKDPVSAILAHKGGEVYRVSPTVSVAEAVRAMNEARVGCVVVGEGDGIEGIFTERDVLVRVVATGRDPESTRVVDVMTSNLVVIEPSTTVEEAMCVVTDKRCRHLPVVAEGRLVGLVSIGDLTRWVVRHQQRRIEDLVGYITGSY